ncbi:alkyl sulfatase C-terminal domain-containing protein [Rhodovulum sp. DZ06]|uniref:alkyl sulfatase C-terminal domain-containing protein n=1 Tax=Rhodovulum sp. DZ06 TaxID=3425126 RepID=UPI003D34CFBE
MTPGPAHPDPLPPRAGGRKMLDDMGGADAVLARARADVEAGEYRRAAEAPDRALLAEPGHAGIRALLAETCEQLGYGCESAAWRNAYLNAAQELRIGPPGLRMHSTISRETAPALTPAQLFGVLAVRRDGLAAQHESLRIALRLEDLGEDWVLALEHGALTWTPGPARAGAALSLRMDKAALAAAVCGDRSLPDSVEAGEIAAEGDLGALRRLSGWIAAPQPVFNIVEPTPGRDL